MLSDHINISVIRYLSILLLVITSAGCKSADKPRGENALVVRNIVDKNHTQQKKEFKNWIKDQYSKLKWKNHKKPLELNSEILKSSLSLGSNFLKNNQKPEGNFNYQFDFITMKFDTGDNQVRQAGALWGVSLIYLFNGDPAMKESLDRGLKFFFENTASAGKNGAKVIKYPGARFSKTGAVALVALSIIEYLRAEKEGRIVLDESYRSRLREHLEGYLQHLLNMKLDNMHFSGTFYQPLRYSHSKYNPYADGEVLLCFIKAAKYLDYKELIPVVQSSSFIIAKDYTMDQWPDDPDSDLTKAFFQWSCMTFWEYQDAGWEESEYYSDYVLTMSWWMIYTHNTLKRTRNTAYAYEGIVPAYDIAVKRGDNPAADDLRYTIDTALSKLTSWQVGGPLQFKNRLLRSQKEFEPIAIGGVMNHKAEPLLRIDVAQHQMHALIWALKYVYKN